MDSLFSIWKVDRDEALRIAESTYKVHVHDFEELIVGVKGGIEHTINCELTLAEAPLVAFVAKGQPHKLTLKLVNDEFDMWVIRFKSEFIADTIFQHYQSFMQRPNTALESGTCFNRLGLLCSLIDAEMKNTTPDLSVVRHLLSALFLMIEAERQRVTDKEQDEPKIQNETFTAFLRILEDNFRRPLNVDFYAEKLFMSARNLNLICHRIMNRSVSELIETRKLTEAKKLLAHTSKSVSEIGFELGYNDKSYFTRVFRIKTGKTPSEFREEVAALLTGTS
jgi:AraC family transcriptional activator of pobA